MVRFIIVCIGLVAISVVAIGTESIRNGISGERAALASRNDETPAVMASDEISAEALNDIATAAGDATPPQGEPANADYDPNDSFKGGFTNNTPKALADDVPAVLPETQPVQETN